MTPLSSIICLNQTPTKEHAPDQDFLNVIRHKSLTKYLIKRKQFIGPALSSGTESSPT